MQIYYYGAAAIRRDVSVLTAVISIDRLLAVAAPLSHLSGRTATKWMLAAAWLLAPLCSLPQVSQTWCSRQTVGVVQSFIFRLRTHPVVDTYNQCTTIGYFQSFTEVVYSLNSFNSITMFLTICCCRSFPTFCLCSR